MQNKLGAVSYDTTPNLLEKLYKFDAFLFFAYVFEPLHIKGLYRFNI